MYYTVLDMAGHCKEIQTRSQSQEFRWTYKLLNNK